MSTNETKDLWYEELGKAIAEECELEEGSAIEHQCGTVWVVNKNGAKAISAMECEDDDE